MGGRLSKEDIERMVKEAEEFKEADEAARKKVDARNELERYAYSVRGSLDRDDLKDKFTEEERSNLQSAADDVIKWLDEQKEADAEEYESKQKELEGVVNPVMVRVYSQVAEEGSSPAMPMPRPRIQSSRRAKKRVRVRGSKTRTLAFSLRPCR